MKRFRIFIARSLAAWCLIIGILTLPVMATAANDTCISAPQFTISTSPGGVGQDIITAVFNAINGILTSISSTFYNNILGSPDYQTAVGSAVLLYITIYGVMIMFNLASSNTSEVVTRLIKIGFVYSVISTQGGWSFFYQWVGGPFLSMMNDLITQFATANAAPVPGAVHLGTLDPNALQNMFPSITSVFSAKFAVIISTLITLSGANPIIAGLLFWGMLDFIGMIIGAIATYVKAIVGLAFMFGIAPIFLVFVLFEKTRQIFVGWLNQIVTFSLQPVMLFAFLSFYLALILNAANAITNAMPDICITKWYSMPGNLWDLYSWRPADASGVPHSGDWVDDTAQHLPLPPPVPMISVLYFLVLCQLGKSFSNYIEQISKDLGGGMGAGVVRGSNVNDWIKNNATGGKGPLGLLGSAVKGAGNLGSRAAHQLSGSGNRSLGSPTTPRPNPTGGRNSGIP